MQTDEKHLEEIKALFESKYYTISEPVIIELNRNFSNGDLNNVLVGINRDFFGIMLKPDDTDENYQLLYITIGNNNAEGHLIELNIHETNRDKLTFYFAQYLSWQYDFLDTVDTFNTYQRQAISLLEKLEYHTINSLEIEKIKDSSATIMVPNKRGIKQITLLSKSSFYKDFFQMIDVSIPFEGEKHVYLMINKRNNYFKIGSSKYPHRREKILQAEEPEIEMIALIPAKVSFERRLHKHFIANKVRGEWFTFSLNELKKIREMFNDYRTNK